METAAAVGEHVKDEEEENNEGEYLGHSIYCWCMYTLATRTSNLAY